MMRIGQERLKRVAAMAGLAKDTAVQPQRRQRRARVAQRLASALARCASRGRPGGVIARALKCLHDLDVPVVATKTE
jgi:hypothetical protein